MGNSALQQMWQSDCRALSLNRWGHCTATSLYVTQLHSIPPPHTHTQTLHSTHSRWSECIGQWYLIGGSVMHINRLHLLPLEKWTFAVWGSECPSTHIHWANITLTHTHTQLEKSHNHKPTTAYAMPLPMLVCTVKNNMYLNWGHCFELNKSKMMTPTFYNSKLTEALLSNQRNRHPVSEHMVKFWPRAYFTLLMHHKFCMRGGVHGPPVWGKSCVKEGVPFFAHRWDEKSSLLTWIWVNLWYILQSPPSCLRFLLYIPTSV